ncbi:Threonine/homoserine/homoserine lactone efflux protein [Actinokineospora alba]|uniref:Threonine/homoserine/homoserine lactone efflux protein n=1 Tax=Actinokineospora alba TaxID=504798 RepID=A0A1H0JGU5_9PSEU|nr:LysE family translocator [Actinokineospora alba]TDP68303.1 threonine/homoserine/homoserine lactone efflux protein [Actinokineospora alba]SDH96458.1 Threonine/homoserine/homoserine lactone efflux protein [Actinokineospora alba]SDO42669.1 Threonine/homoserine/homoserine lactone efflux protein [Actinokineospora alba]
MSVEFWLTTFIIVITPGTGVVYTMAAGLARGSRASVVAALGSTVGIVPHMLAAITGLAALLHTSALAFQILKYLGVAYLLYMAISTFRDKSALTVTEETGPQSVRKVITSAIVLNLLNPKLTIFFFAFLPQFVTTGDPNAFLRMIAMSGVFMAMTFVVFTAYGLFAAAIRTHVISRPKILAWMLRTFAGAFLALGAKLAFTDK